MTLETRFWSKVVKTDECWQWTGAKNEHGYGHIGEGGPGRRVLKAHRVSWVLHNGPVPDGFQVLHKCDNPQCTNPEHLFLGTHLANMQDKKQKGRVALNPPPSSAKLTIEEVRTIRSLCALNILSKATIAVLFGVSRPTISHIHRGYHWGAV